MGKVVHIIIVTHNSADVLPSCLMHLSVQSSSFNSVIIVDSGSTDTGYLDTLSGQDKIKLIKSENRGFGRANNLGFNEIVDEDGVVIFLNPDTFLPADYISRAVAVLSDNPEAGVVSGKLLGYDIKKGTATGRIDSTGIFRTWYGRWYDRGKGEEELGRYNQVQNIPAVCGALMVCRMSALQNYHGEIFDNDFFLYKEDIELSIRLRRDGWKLLYDPRLIAFHCRGWQNKRKEMPFSLRHMAAENELKLYRKHPSPYMLWALMKYLSVAVFHL